MKLRLALLSLTALGALTFAAQAEDLKIGLASAQTGIEGGINSCSSLLDSWPGLWNP